MKRLWQRIRIPVLSRLVSEKTVVFFGDSITQAGVNPDGYITLLHKELRKQNKVYQLIGAGISGNKVPDLLKRVDKDVLLHKPDLVFIYIGINDVWHFAHPYGIANGGGTPKDVFGAGLTDLIVYIQKSGSKVIVCTPGVIGELPHGMNDQDELLDAYADFIRKVAMHTQCPVCDLRFAFLHYLARYNPDNRNNGTLTTDGVHLNANGNQLVATEMLPFLV